eukprot:m.263339 g.263339  ORF g.263339 m.263339 type:complete len:246 (+) comp50029_c0_seq1:149-886(+)
MPLEIIGAGLGRTGTSSLKAALEILGFPCYHMDEFLQHPHHLGFWAEVSHQVNQVGEPELDFERVFSSYTAAIDAPTNCVYATLMKQYPQAKVILTHRDGGKWYDSAYPTIYQQQYSFPLRVRLIFLPWWKRFDDTVTAMFWDKVMQGSVAKGRDATAKRVKAWNDEVIATVPPERLLVFTVQDGWDPLCRFLNMPVPNVPFPRVNDTKAFQEGLRTQKIEGWTMFAGCVVAAAIISGAISKHLL